jgi:mannose-6-phosphate isomerase-like protein (cupin superfamily)
VARVVDKSELPVGRYMGRFEGGAYGSSVSVFFGQVEPGGGPVLHRHPYEETFVLDSGTVVFTADGEELEAHGGQIVVVPAGAKHRFRVTGEEPLRFVSIHPAPAMEQEDLEG